MAKTKEKKKGKAGKTVAGAGILAIIAAILGLDPFGLGIGLGAGTGTGTGNGNKEVSQESRNDDYLMNNNQMPTVIPAATATPVVEQPEENTNTVELTEVVVKVSKNTVVYNGEESTAQAVTDALASGDTDTETILVKVTLEDAVYDTVEELKNALESKGIKYEIVE